MADVAANLYSWSTTAASNSPADATTIGAGLADNFQQLQATVRQDLANAVTDVASGATVDLGAVASNYVRITGTTTITAFGTVSAGIWKWVRFAGALTLTHNATSLILPGGGNITTVAGDTACFVSEGSGNWRCLWYSGSQVNTQSVTSGASTVSVFNSGPTTVNAFGAATTLTMGASASIIGIGSAAVNNEAIRLDQALTSGGVSNYATLLRMRGTLVGAIGDTGSLSAVYVAPTSITTQGNTETIGIVASTYISEPVITVGTGDSITTAATLYIANAPTEGSTNAALYVASGATILTNQGAGVEVLRLNTERAWTFEQQSSGSTTELVLRSRTASKVFRIQASDTTNILSVLADSAEPTLTINGVLIGQASQNVFNTVSTTVNAFGAATTLRMGASTGYTAIGAATNNYTGLLLSRTVTSGGAGTDVYGMHINTALQAAAGDTNSHAHLRISGVSITTQGATEAISVAASMYLNEPNITVGTGDTITTASTLYIASAPTEGSTNAALYVASGATMLASALCAIGDTANANMTVGLTINGGANDNQHFCIKNTDVAHGLTSGGIVAAETDDIMTVQKVNPSFGGVRIMAFAEDAALTSVLQLISNGGTADTTDTTSSDGLIALVAAEHNGANATAAPAANSNAFVVKASTGAGTYATRMLLKSDDGELHLGNTTLVALDDEDDALLVRAFQKESSVSGIIKSQWDNPFYDYRKLREANLVGEKDERGEFLFPLQPRLAVHEGAIWQNYTKLKDMEQRISDLAAQNMALEAKLHLLENRHA